MTALHDELVTNHGPHPGILDAEAAVAGACMVSNRFADAAAEILDEADFYDFGCASVFAAACELAGAGKPVDATAVKNRLIETDRMRNLGANMGRLLDLMHGAPAALGTVQFHAEAVKADSVRRKVQMACVRGAGISGHVGFELEHVARILDDIHAAMPDMRADQPLWAGDDLDGFIGSLAEPLGDTRIPTPWPVFDDRVTLAPGRLIVAAARPGGGKSIFGLQVAVNAAVRHDIPALVSSMEMPRAEVNRRVFANLARVNLERLEKHVLDDGDWARINAAAERLRGAPLVIDDQGHTTLAHLRARLRWMARSGRPARLIVVDYIQLMTATRKAESRSLEVAEFTRGLKLMAIELNVCVIALAQLNRGSEQRGGKRPILADLRESGSIENDADVVLFVNREPEFEGNPRLGEVEIYVAKQRSGPAGVEIQLAFQGHYASFMPMARG